ncbi:IgA peptidase M64-domain-containing protein [Linnemannia elongata]|nr:IgA peptidase M64-domain-containing protein [Linnemannia elongata]
MRTCLFLSSAIALVVLAATTTTADAKKTFSKVSSYAVPNDEINATGYFTLIDRETQHDGTRLCSILDRGETKVFRNLWPANRIGDRLQILRRNVHDESHHGGSHTHEENFDSKEAKDLFELNMNSKEWALMVDKFLVDECDQVKDETLNNGADVDFWGSPGISESNQQVFENHDSVSGLQEGDEVRKLVDNGPDRNRVDIVFMGDGYTLEEREKFFADMNRLVNDMFIGETFQSFLPLFNVHALFRPSKESGIGSNGHWKDTSFRLYRDGTELRGIYVANPKAAREACRAVGQYACDFPSLIGNDPYYGGLGGEFVISTSSNKSGTIVLRHELGHSLIDVGEEYDGGQVYSGVNAERWSIQNIKWKHWLTDATPREEKNVLRAQDYAWYDLKKGPYKVKFNSDGNWKRWSLKISHSGVDTDDSFEVYLDGKRLNWTSPGGYDRDFSEWDGEEGFSAGAHEIEFRQGAKYDDEPVDGSRPIRQLCSVTMHEFMGEDQYRFDNSVISAYPTYDLYGRKTWRSNHEFCLMRNMSSTQFCSICKEGLWHRLLSKASLLDEIQVDCQREDDDGGDEKVSKFEIEAKLIPLGQFREDQSKRVKGEAYTFRWFRNGIHQAKLDDQIRIEVPAADEGTWEFKAEFTTPEVRKDPRGLLKASKVFVVAKHLCSN